MNIKKNIYSLYLSLIKKNKYFHKQYINSLNKRSNYRSSNELEDIHRKEKIS